MGILSKLKNGDTVFRSLSYGKDRPNGGSSNAPYIQTPLPGLYQDPGPPDVEDSILRGSLKAPISAKDDVLRLTRYLFDIKNIDGYLFTAKQNLLSRTAVKTEASFGLGYGGASKEMAVTGIIGGLYTGNVTMKPNNGAINEGIYTPLSTILQAGVGYLGTHYNKQGLDPTGTIPTLSINKYQDVVFANNKSIPEDPKVPFSLIKKSQRANLNAARKVTALSNQQVKTNAELAKGPSQVNFAGIYKDTSVRKTSALQQVEQNVNAFLTKWDQYLDKRAVTKLEQRSKAADDAISKANTLSSQVEEAMNAPKVYTNRLLKLWDASGLNLNNPFESISSVLYSYGGGPGSTIGIGGTDIKFATTNDGITPSRTNILPFEPFVRPQVTYLLDNIFGDDSVSISYTSLLGKTGEKINEVDLFSSLDYLTSYNSSPYFNAPWDTQDVKIIDSLRETPNGTKVSYYQKEFALAAANSNNPQIPITKDVVSNVKVRGPLGASDKFLTLYSDTDNAREFDQKVFIIPDENPNHQTWAAQDPTTFGSLANKAFEETNPYIESNYSKTLTPNNKLISNKDLKFTTGSGQDEINFKQYNGASYEYSESGSILDNDAPDMVDPIYPDPNSPEPTPIGKEYPEGQTRKYENLSFTEGSSGNLIKFNKYTGASQEYMTVGTKFDQNNFGPTNDSEYKQYTGSNLGDNTIKNATPDEDALRYEKLSRSDINLRNNESFYSKFNDDSPHPSYKRTREEETARNPGRFPLIRHEQRVHTGDPGRVIPSYKTVLDSINARGVYSSAGNGSGRYSDGLNDFVHFRIGIVDSKSNGGKTWYMNFRSYIDSFSDSFNSTWTDVRYMGRGEAFKRYDTFSRTINMSFTVVATSQAEMYGIYDKLRLLATSIAPSYVNGSYMAGNLAKLTVGGYVMEQYGIITGFTYEIPQEASWEIIIGDGALIGDELPMMIKVTGFTFVPVYDFIPQMTNDDNFKWISKNIPNPGKIASSGIDWNNPTYNPDNSTDITWGDNPASTTNPSGGFGGSSTP